MTKSSQQKWNESNPEKIRGARLEYEKQYKKITIRLNKNKNKELLDWYKTLSREEKSNIQSAFIDFLYKYKESQ